MKRFLLLVILIFAFAVSYNVNAQRQQEEESIVVNPTKVSKAIYHDVFGPLRDLPALTPEEVKALEEKYADRERNEELKERLYPYFSSEPQGPDPVWQKQMGQNQGSKATLQNFAGQSSYSDPPDCNGTVGPNHYMQTINVTYTIYNKTGTLLAGPTAMNLLFSGVPGAGVNDGDPIIMYDEQADRWLAAEFSGVSSNPDYMLIAVSTTNDPTGTWNRWSFVMNGFPDYMKFGIWRDGYYMGANASGAGEDDIYVFERSVMIAGGASPQVVQFDNANRPNSGFHCVLPMDNDGTFASAGTPGQFITINDGAWGYSDQLWIYELSVNWTTPGNSTFNRVQTLNVASFDSNFGTSWDNITQPGSQKLDAIPQVLMQRAQYRNWGSSQSVVCCHTVDVDGTDHAGIRWYELQNTGSGWSIRQYGTYAPDAHNRWMASIAMNNQHEIGLGYSVSSSSLYPAIRYCGQSASANALANGILDMAETSIQVGSASQTTSNRWGDYANIALDPNNDHDFWFTTEYNISGSQRGTSVASFQFSSPSTPPTADFTANNTHPANSLTTVIFTDQSTNSPTTWSWTFTPNTVTYVSGNSTSQNPQLRFNNFGEYTVSLYVTNAYGNDTETKTDYIHVGQPGLWTGNTSTAWNTNTNWENHEVPLSTMDVSITPAAVNWPTKTGNLTIGTDCNSVNMASAYTELTITGDLTIQNGKTFYVDPSGTALIKVGGNWTATGTFTQGLSTVEFYGTDNSTLGSSKGKGTDILVTSLFENFDGGSMPTGWSVNNSSATVVWNVDASPNPPGFYSSAYSLNYNDGTDYDDGNGNNGTVTTTAIDNSNANSTTISFYYQLQTENDANYDWVAIDVLRASDNFVLQTVGGDGTSIADANNWTLYTITGNASVVAEGSIKLRFTFSADDGSYNTYFGWFIDDLKVEKDITITSITFNNLTVNKSGGTLITNSGVDVQQTFTINPGAYFTNNAGNTFNVLGNAIFMADPTGMASFIDNGTSNFTNPPNVQLYLSDANPGNWHFVSSPVAGAQSGLFTGSYLYSFDESADAWVNITSQSVTLNNMQGYSAYTPLNNPALISFQGSLNNGSYSIPVTRNSNATGDHGWNLVGNPYPSSLDWDASGWTKNNVNNTIYYYSGTGGTSNYKYYIGAGGETPGVGTAGGSNIIPPLQGFFVHAAGAGSLGVTNTLRVHSNHSYYKNANELPLIRIEASYENLSDETIIRFFNGSTSGFDGDYDAYKLFADNYPQIYTLTPSGTELSISTLPEIADDLVVPVSFTSTTAGTYTLTLTEMNGFDQQGVLYLEDLLLNHIEEFGLGSLYTFDYNPSMANDRFLLHFSNPLGINDYLVSTPSVYTYGHVVYVQNPAGFNGQITIYNILGESVYSRAITGEGLIAVPLNRSTGTYLVQLKSDNQFISKKVFIQ